MHQLHLVFVLALLGLQTFEFVRKLIYLRTCFQLIF
jgi:hypothetical protein